MKAYRTCDNGQLKITLDNEAVKAIRFVLGFNTDLRVSLKHVNRDAIWKFLDDNRFGIFGISAGLSKPDATSELWPTYEAILNDVVNQVVR